MSAGEERYVVLYLWEGQEVTSPPESRADAEARAKTLEAGGCPVGSVMTEADARRYWEDRYAVQYRGVLIPDGMRADGVPYERFITWKQGVDAALAPLIPMLGLLASDTPCSVDDKGECRNHGREVTAPCPDGMARKFLAASAGEGDR